MKKIKKNLWFIHRIEITLVEMKESVEKNQVLLIPCLKLQRMTQKDQLLSTKFLGRTLEMNRAHLKNKNVQILTLIN